MARRRGSRISERMPLVACLLVVGSVVLADLPADAAGPACFGRSLFIRLAGAPSESGEGESDAIAAALAAPVRLGDRRGSAERTDGLGSGAIALTGMRAPGDTDVSRRVTSPQPTVIILTPEDQATVPAGTLRVRGIVRAHGAKVRVVVNGVRAIVREGTFAAGVPVSVNTMVLTAVATTASGASARHQIGLVVGETFESLLRLHPLAGNGAPFTFPGFSFRSAPASSAKPGNGEGEPDPAGPCREAQAVAAPSVDSDPTPATPMTGSAEAIATAQDAGTAASAVHLPLRSRSFTVEPRRERIDRTAEVRFLHSREGSRTDSGLLTQRGFLTQIAADMSSLRLAGNRQGPAGPSLPGMRPGNEYSFVVLFVLGADGLWRVWWF